MRHRFRRGDRRLEPRGAHGRAGTCADRRNFRDWVWRIPDYFWRVKIFWFSLIALVPVGFWMMLQMGCSNTLIQAMVPDRLRGRVMSLYSMMFMGMAPLGSLLGGVAANWIGAPWTLAIGGIIGIAGAGWFYLQLPSLNAEANRLIAAQGMFLGEAPE